MSHPAGPCHSQGHVERNAYLGKVPTGFFRLLHDHPNDHPTIRYSWSLVHNSCECDANFGVNLTSQLCFRCEYSQELSCLRTIRWEFVMSTFVSHVRRKYIKRAGSYFLRMRYECWRNKFGWNSYWVESRRVVMSNLLQVRFACEFAGSS